MPVKITPAYMAEKFFKAAFKRKTTQGKVNVLIDAFLEDKPFHDQAAHFINEVLIHKHPRQHIRNTIKYGGVDRMLEKLM